MNNIEQKQVIVVRKDLKMNKGKIAAQASHASMKIFFDRISEFEKNKDNSYNMKINIDKNMYDWINAAFTKVCLQVNSEKELIDIYNKAKSSNLPVCFITDNGKTTFHDIPTKTCIAIGPASTEEINKVTGDLKLLS